MADWKVQYFTALKARSELEQADADIYDRCTKLADQNAGLKAEIRKLHEATRAETATSVPTPAPLISYGFRRQTSPQPPSESESTSQLRLDFAKAQQDRADLQNQVDLLRKELDAATTREKGDAKKIANLSNTSTRLATKLKDREEELRGKAKLLVDVQDENATLNLQLNVAERDATKLKKENEELIERWMKRVGKEADQMNEQGKFG